MSREPFNDPEAVPLGLLRRYLRAHGWRPGPDTRPTATPEFLQNSPVMLSLREARPGGRRNFDIYVLSDGGAEIELLVPREPTATDYLRRIDGAIRTLSDVEGRDPGAVIGDVRTIGYDVVRSRIPDAIVHDDAIPLEVATNYVNGVRALLSATATTELQPSPYFLRVRKEGSEYADRCRFAHTFRGSFGFTVESPIVPNDQPTFDQVAQTPPFERRVIERFARGVRSVHEAVMTGDTGAIVSSTTTGFSANACELFADLVENTSPGGLIFGFSFSPEWRTDTQLLEAPPLTVSLSHVEVSRAAATALRSEFTPRLEKVFGRVVRLESESDPSDLLNPSGAREIAIRCTSPDLGEINVRVALGPLDYQTAIDAHRAGRPVMVSGTLEKKKRVYILTDPTEFSMA